MHFFQVKRIKAELGHEITIEKKNLAIAIILGMVYLIWILNVVWINDMIVDIKLPIREYLAFSLVFVFIPIWYILYNYPLPKSFLKICATVSKLTLISKHFSRRVYPELHYGVNE